VTLAFSHMIANVVLLYPLLKLMGFNYIIAGPRSYKYVICFGALKVASSIFSLYSLYLLSVSYSQTLRTLLPVLSIILSKIYYNESQTIKVYVSIGCIVAGVSLASVTELSVDYGGFLCSIVMLLASVATSFHTRHYSKELNMHPLVMLLNLHIVAFFVIIPIWLVVDVLPIYNDYRFYDMVFSMQFLRTLIFQGTLSFFSHCSKYLLMAIVSAVSYTVINSAKSLVKILLGLVYYSQGYTFSNVFGSLFAVYGVIMYTNAKNEMKTE